MNVVIRWRFPIWKDAYVGALAFFHGLGLLRVNPDVAVKFIIRHTKFYLVRSDGSQRRI